VRVYLVILHDRHTDDAITVHATIEGADAEVKATKAQYPEYEWKRTKSDVWLQLWEVRYLVPDDAPWICVEEHEVRG
jgi:hypothetical protein